LHSKAIGPSRLGIEERLALRQGQYATLSAIASLMTMRTTVSLEATNLLDETANLFAFGTPFAEDGASQTTPLRPRTLRLSLRRRY
jgi:iron complex outermembrane recepter protein